jgi:Regulator of chromosome condensation (RCC1) repeat
MKQTISRSSLAVMLQLTMGLIPTGLTGFVVASATSATAQTASGAAQLELLWRPNAHYQPLIAVADNLPVGFNGSVKFVEDKKPDISLPLSNLGAGQNTIASGNGFLCYITPTNGVKCWGANDKGQLGNGGNANVGKAGATDVKFGSDALTGVFAITAGDSHACAIMRADLSVKCWGANESGQLGNNTEVSSTSAVDVSSLDYS